ncbi:MAG: GDYXXLXY protein, partial [Acinetobacter sp.]
QNPNNRYTMLYPASKSFLFAEGLAECYQQAEYAEFKVDEQGNAILNALKGNQLQDLGCEKQVHWLDSFDRAKT